MTRLFPFKRIVIVNRGEPAVRLIHAVRELNAEHQAGLCTIALFTEPDASSLFVREADEALLLGPSTYEDPKDGRRKSAYLDYARLEDALVSSRAEAAWVGWGFVAEHDAFADLCDRLGVVFIGPSGHVMRQLGDKIASKRLAEAADVPVLPWSGGSVANVDDAARHAGTLGYPVVIKATAGGGGRGIRRVMQAQDLPEAFERARSEAYTAFGNDTVFIEKMASLARHIEVQIVGDKHGMIWAVGIRDCSLQRRNQKVVEEAPSPAIDAAVEKKLLAAARRLAEKASYFGAGTVEFLFEPSTQQFYFMEMNTRLQVEHPVTELTTGLDLVKLQLHVAAGGRLNGEPPATGGHAIEVRLNAEDPDNDFAPSPGLLRLFRAASGPGVRIDSGVEQGDQVSPDFDSMVAKIIAHGATRAEAMARLERALRETAVVIEAGTTNKSFLLQLLTHPEVLASEVDIGWLDRSGGALRTTPRPFADVALLCASIQAFQEEAALEWAEFAKTAGRGRPSVREGEGFALELRHNAQKYAFVVHRVAESQYRIRVDTETLEAAFERSNAFESCVLWRQRRYRIMTVRTASGYVIEVDGVQHRISRDEGGAVRAPSPALVVAVHVKVGDEVTTGQRLLVIEAMKNELVMTAPGPGRIREICAQPNTTIAAGATLLVIDAVAEGTEPRLGQRTVFSQATAAERAHPSAKECCCQALRDIAHFVLGFDVTAQEVAARVEEYVAARRQVSMEDRDVIRLEDDVFEILTDILQLHSRDPVGQELLPQRECLTRFIRTLDSKGKGLPAEFLTSLTKGLRHYGVVGLDRSQRLEEALLLIYKSYARWGERLQPCMRLLEVRLENAEAVRPHAGKRFKELLARLVHFGGERSLAMHDLASQVRFRIFDMPVLDGAKVQAYQQFESQLDALIHNPSDEKRQHLLEMLAATPLPLAGMLAHWLKYDVEGLRPALFEVLCARYYRAHNLSRTSVFLRSGYLFLTAALDDKGRHRAVVAMLVNSGTLDTALNTMSALHREMPDHPDTLVEIFVAIEDGSALTDVQERLRGMIDGAGFPSSAVRICFTFLAERQRRALDHTTFFRGPTGYQEVGHYRGIHPMRAGDLETWRLRNFEVERLPSPEDIYLYRGVARENPKDIRLFAFAEVRDLTKLEGNSGEGQDLPHLERMALQTLSCVRDRQFKNPRRERLHWNRVVLYLAPPLQLAPDAVRDALQSIGPSTRNLGIEKVIVRTRAYDEGLRAVIEKSVHLWFDGDRIVRMRIQDLGEDPIRPLTPYAQRVVRLRARGLTCPYEIVGMLAPRDRASEVGFPHGEFLEHDLDATGRLEQVARPYGMNQANVVVGMIKSFTTRYPEGVARVIVLGDPTRGMGALAEPECRRIIAALDLAQRLRLPVEWFPLSAGAKIAMDSGTENLDWTARVVRRIVEFTQSGGEINIIVDGVNVGAQSYWNAEATMLMHTRGILVMTPKGAMVLTGKHALDFSGSVSAEDNRGIGGVEQIMGPNGEAQYYARDLADACGILFRHYEHTYVHPGERFPRRGHTQDPSDRDITESPYPADNGDGFSLVGDVFSVEKNPQRKKPFAIRPIMRAAIDSDSVPLERWAMMREAEIAVIWDAIIGGIPVALVGVESRQLSRGGGVIPGDGPESWSGGTLFPLSSKKVARAINAASGNRPVVVLANLSGFDGSPESMRKLQLEYGAEIGRAVVNFHGPMLFCVISRYHGGAYVVFSGALNCSLMVAALEGSYASVIGGAPAAAVVFGGEVDEQVYADPAVRSLQAALASGAESQRHHVLAQLSSVVKELREKKRGEMAARFDSIHTVQRAQRVGSINEIVPARRLRRFLIDALERSVAASDRVVS